MTQTVPPAAAAPGARRPVRATPNANPPSMPRAQVSGVRSANAARGRLGRVRRGLRETPGRMRLVSTALVVTGLVVGLGAAQSFAAADGSLVRASDDAAQLVRLQEIQTRLVRADADVTNAFLVGGLEPAAQRQDYDQAIDRAAGLIALAARAQAADGDALAALNTTVMTYTGTVQQARANNRQGLPLGAQYLRTASAGLRADALPLLESLTHANETRAQTEFAAARRAWLVGLTTGVLGLASVAFALVWLARRTHRYVNLPVAASGVVVVAVLAVTAVALAGVATTVGSTRDGSYAASRALSDARIAAFDAKANESLTLISRGSGAAFEKAWAASSGTVDQRLADAVTVGGARADLPAAWATYTGLHQQIRALDDGGGWEQAVSAATSRDTGTANAAFDAFDTASAQRLTASSDTMSAALQDASRGLVRDLWLAILAGVIAAALAWWGLSQRIEEYR